MAQGLVVLVRPSNAAPVLPPAGCLPNTTARRRAAVEGQPLAGRSGDHCGELGPGVSAAHWPRKGHFQGSAGFRNSGVWRGECTALGSVLDLSAR